MMYIHLMKYFFLIAICFNTEFCYAQPKLTPLSKRVIVKSNVLSLIAKRPTLSIEKLFSNTFSTELSFVQGQFNNILFTDHYDYNGFLIRAKKYFSKIDYGTANMYGGIYVGNLIRNIETTGQSLGNGWIGYPSRYFSSNSLRFGSSVGLLYISKKRIVIDGQISLGYGRYLNLDKSNPDTYANGFLDTHVWISIGYCF